MKNLAFIWILFLSPILSAQEAPGLRVHNRMLQQGELLNIGPGAITFVEVISDSRCPVDVTCVWAGEAKILLAVYEKGEFLKNIVVSTAAGILPINFSEGATEVNISEIILLPYPNTKSKGIKPEYRLQLQLKEKLQN